MFKFNRKQETGNRKQDDRRALKAQMAIQTLYMGHGDKFTPIFGVEQALLQNSEL